MGRIAIAFILLAVLYLIRDWLPLPLFRLPGDFEYRSERLHFLFPITTCLLVGLFVSLAFSLFSHR